MPAASKAPNPFSSLLGRLVEKKEKEDSKSNNSDEPAPPVPVPPAAPPPPKPERMAFGLDTSSGPPPASPSEPQPQPLPAGLPGLVSVPVVFTPEMPQPTPRDFRPAGSPSALANGGANQVPMAGPALDLRPVLPTAAERQFHPVSTPPVAFSTEMAQVESQPGSVAAARPLDRCEAQPQAVTNPATIVESSPQPAPATLSIDPRGISSRQESPNPVPQPAAANTAEASPAILTSMAEPFTARTGAPSFQPEAREKPVAPKAKSADSSLPAHSGHPVNEVWEPRISLPTQVAAMPESGASTLENQKHDSGPGEAPASAQPGEPPNSSQWNDGHVTHAANLAFAARLVPLPERAATPLTSAASVHPSEPAKNQTGGNASYSSGRAAAQISQESSKEFSKESSRENRDGEEPPAALPPAAPAPSALSASLVQATPGQPQSNRSPENQPDQTSAPAPAVKDAQTAAPTGNTHPSAAAPARDIHLQLHQGDQRVDVRLSERSGEVHVAVRTADPQLAGALRDDLPGLSDRLEQSGFRADTWHAAMAAMPSGERRIETAGSAFSNPQESGRRQPDQGQENQQHQQRQSPRQPKAGAPQNSDSRRKDFQWLMSQLP